ncbi:DUF2953 domain-containing protein [Clostridium sp. WILCCON 0269]|uniref:DUF2953 domain-containing protein n=1 Tax=Candidatus Clostridium eludens TaxID=3381663 RepID=A0ABW8SFB2_9CLOT
MIVLKIIGSIILLFIIFLILIIISNIKYKIKLIYVEYKINYNIKVNALLNIISITGKGNDENIELFIKLVFLKKKLKINYKENKCDKKFIKSKYKEEYNTDESSFDILNGIKKVYTYKDYLIKVISIIKPEHVNMEGIYGFEDPYITGIFSGFISATSLIFPGNSIRLSPNFSEKFFDLHIKVNGKLKIMTLILLIFKLLILDIYRNMISKLKMKFTGRSKTRKNKLAKVR